MTQPTLVVLAAGMGSRYGGLKQMDPMGPNDETVLDYSLYDAIRAGFQKVIFIIREDFKNDFQNQICQKFAHLIQVEYAYQKLDDLPAGHSVPKGRVKPWGTTHALLAARHLIDSVFVVINADDFYGANAYQSIYKHFSKMAENHTAVTEQYIMIGYPLANTLSEHGHVNRGICSTDNQQLVRIEEHTEIIRQKDGTCRGYNSHAEMVTLKEHSLVSMNFWGFPKEFMAHLETFFENFLQIHGTKLKTECYLPAALDQLIQEKKAHCHITETSGKWIGVTYPEDKAEVLNTLQALIKQGKYPHTLWA